MGCNCNNKEARLSWVRGNDVLLKVWLYERSMTDGEETLLPFALDDAEGLSVRLVNYYGRTYDVSFAVGEESNEIVTDILGTTPTGYYSLEVTLKKGGRAVRSFESGILRIVDTNGEAQTVLTPIESGRHAETEMTIQMVSQAVARGKSAYELWLEAGNEGSLQDYLDLFTKPATRTSDGLMSKEAFAKLESIAELNPDDVEDSWNRIFNNN